MAQDLNSRLKQLALTAQSHPAQTPQRQLALTRLVEGIWTSGEIGHPQRGRWPTATYHELHSEALQKTCLYICRNIENYRPEHPVMAWVNNLMGYKIKEAAKDLYRAREVALPSLDDLDRRFLAQKSHRSPDSLSTVALLQRFLREDPEGLLAQKAIRGRPELTFQYLAIARHIQDQTWAQISAETQVSIQTLCSFFNRRLHNLEPYFHRHLQA